MRRRAGSLAESAAVAVSAILTGVACCGPVVIQWLGFLVYLAGGRALLMGLVRYEVPVVLVVAAASLLGRRLARGRLILWANTLLAGTALFLAMLRLMWEVRRGVVMAVEPVYFLFTYRQAVLLVAAGLVLVVRLAFLTAGLWRRVRSTQACPVPAPRKEGSRPTWRSCCSSS